jgi:Tfp pilus assembly ATPase PilU
MRSAGDGQQTFDQDLLRMFRQELISTTEALHHATNPEALQMTLRGIGGTGAVQETPHDRATARHAGRPG